MITVGNIREWSGHDIVDDSGSKIGKMESVYVDTATDEPAFATVTLGMLGGKRLAFVPLDGAIVGPAYVKVRWGKSLVKDAPAIDTDGELAAVDEPAIFTHYGLTYAPGAGGERRLGRR